jgi:aromatic ring hydroxylase
MSATVIVLLVTGLILVWPAARAVRRELRSIIEIYRQQARKVDEEQRKPMFRVFRISNRS